MIADNPKVWKVDFFGAALTAPMSLGFQAVKLSIQKAPRRLENFL
jgi:hypothetical protein